MLDFRQKFILLLFSAVIFILPFFEGGKTAAAELILFVLMPALTLFIWRQNGGFNLGGIKYPAIFLSLFLVASGLSIFYSPEKYLALKIFLDLLACGLLLFLSYNFIDSRQKINWFGWLAVALGAVLSLQGLYDFLMSQNFSYLRLVSTFYHHIPFGEFIAYPFLIAFSLLFFGNNSKKAQILLFCANILFFVALYFNHCRGAWISLAISFIVLALLFKKQILTKSSLKKFLIIILAGSAIIIGVCRIKSWQASQASVAASYSGPETIAENAATARILFWQRAWDIFKDYPITGAGLASYPDLHKQYIQPPFYYSADPHNFYLKLLAENGIIAFLLFAAFIASVFQRFASSLKNLRTAAGLDNAALISLAMIAGVVCGLLNNAVNFGWNYLANLVVFFFFIGVSLRACDIYNNQSAVNFQKSITPVFFSLSLILLVGGISIFVSDHYYRDAEYYSDNGDIENAVISLKSARQINPVNPQYSTQLAFFYLSSNSLSRAHNEISRALYWADNDRNFILQSRIYQAQNQSDLAVQSLRRALEKNPYNLAAYIDLATIYQNQSEFAEVNRLLSRVLPVYKKEYVLSPFYITSDKKLVLNQLSSLYAINANAYAKLGNDGEAQIQLNAAAEYAQ
jgi:O-antigen ligase